MKNTKGFTLIELLAVIVILAIIAVITVPKVAEMIESSRKGSAEDAFYGSLKAAELGWSRALQNNSSLAGTTCKVTSGAFVCTDSNVKVSSSGTTPDSGTITLSPDGEATVKADGDNPLVFNGYKCSGNTSKATCTKK